MKVSHYFQDFLFWMLEKVLNALNNPGCMLEVIFLLQNTFGANHMPPWWHCMRHHASICLYFSTLRLLILTKSLTPFAEMKPQTCKEPPPCFPVARRHSLMYCSPALRWTVPMFFCTSFLALFPCWRYSLLSATLPWRPILASRLVYLGLISFCQFWADGKSGHRLTGKGNKLDLFSLVPVFLQVYLYELMLVWWQKVVTPNIYVI